MPINPGISQKKLFPVAKELADNGHKILALKTIAFATRTDLVLLAQSRNRLRQRRLLLKLQAEAYKLELQACAVLHNHHQI